jgi:branched-chain amino acid transport system substrate-binding protein
MVANKSKSRWTGAAVLAIAASLGGNVAVAQQQPVKVGMMLPGTGTFAALGSSINNGFRQYVNEQGGKLAGLPVEYFNVDDESDPAKATENVNKLIKRDKVDVLVGTVHSGVVLAMAKAAKDNNTLLIVPNAGADELTGPLCAPNIFRVSYSNWQTAYPMGKVAADKGHKKVVTLAWKYAAGLQAVDGFKAAFEKGGGKVIKDMTLPFPNVEFQPFLAEIAALKPDAVFVFFAGAGATKFVKEYAAAGLNKTIPLYSSGFLTEGNLDAMGDAAQGLNTTLHYADGLKTPKNDSFRLDYVKTYKQQPDVYAVQGYDSAQLLDAGLKAVGGDLKKRAEMVKAMETARVDSPRGAFTLSKAHNPIQDMYLRKVVGRENQFQTVAIKNLADPALGCKM